MCSASPEEIEGRKVLLRRSARAEGLVLLFAISMGAATVAGCAAKSEVRAEVKAARPGPAAPGPGFVLSGPLPRVDAGKASINCLDPKCVSVKGFPAWSKDRKRVALVSDYSYVFSIAGGADTYLGLRMEVFRMRDGKLLSVVPMLTHEDRVDAEINIKKDCKSRADEREEERGEDRGSGDPQLCGTDPVKEARMTRTLKRRFESRAAEINKMMEEYVGGVFVAVPTAEELRKTGKTQAGKGSSKAKSVEAATGLVMESRSKEDSRSMEVVVRDAKSSQAVLQRFVALPETKEEIKGLLAKVWVHGKTGTFIIRVEGATNDIPVVSLEVHRVRSR